MKLAQTMQLKYHLVKPYTIDGVAKVGFSDSLLIVARLNGLQLQTLDVVFVLREKDIVGVGRRKP